MSRSPTERADKACDGGSTLEGQQKALELGTPEELLGQRPMPWACQPASCVLMTWSDLWTFPWACRKTSAPKAGVGSLLIHCYLNSVVLTAPTASWALAEVR